MPARQKSKKPAADGDTRSGAELEAAAIRKLCTLLWFWQFCGSKRCLRAQGCAGGAKECFRRFWPEVPEDAKITIRALIKARNAGLSEHETAAAIERDLARYREETALIEALQAPAAPNPRAPNPLAPNPSAPSPRLRVL